MENRLTCDRRPPKRGKEHIALDLQVEQLRRAASASRVQSEETGRARAARPRIPNDVLTAIVQTRDGYIWVGTEGGLARFDGVRFVDFMKANTSAFHSNVISDLMEDREGNLWLGTGAGLQLLRNPIVATYTPRDGIVSELNWSVYEDCGGTVWVGTAAGLSRLRNGEWRAYTTKDALPSDIVGSSAPLDS